MYNLTNAQFKYQQRYQQLGLGKDDIVDLEGVVRRVQEGEMKESSKVKDLTYTFWFVPFSNKGSIIRCCAMALLAEEAEKNVHEDAIVLVSGKIITGSYKSPAPWVKLSKVEVVSAARVQPTADEL